MSTILAVDPGSGIPIRFPNALDVAAVTPKVHDVFGARDDRYVLVGLAARTGRNSQMIGTSIRLGLACSDMGKAHRSLSEDRQGRLKNRSADGLGPGPGPEASF
jgi:hypothetical protein